MAEWSRPPKGSSPLLSAVSRARREAPAAYCVGHLGQRTLRPGHIGRGARSCATSKLRSQSTAEPVSSDLRFQLQHHQLAVTVGSGQSPSRLGRIPGLCLPRILACSGYPQGGVGCTAAGLIECKRALTHIVQLGRCHGQHLRGKSVWATRPLSSGDQGKR